MCLGSFRSLGSLRCLGSLGSLRSLGSLGVSGFSGVLESQEPTVCTKRYGTCGRSWLRRPIEGSNLSLKARPAGTCQGLPRCRWRPSKKRCLETGPSPSGRCPSLREADDVRRDRLIGFVKHFLRSLHDSKSRESWSLRSLGSRESWSLRIIGSRPLAVFWNASVLEPLSHGDSARIASRSLQARIHDCPGNLVTILVKPR